MRLIDAATVHAVLPYGPLIEALRRGHREDVIAERVLMRQGSADFLVWPAWQPRTALGVKLVTVFPGNAAAGRPAIGGVYLLFDGGDGRVLAALDGRLLPSARPPPIRRSGPITWRVRTRASSG
jgi:alanine dehydrogenase